MDAIFLTMGGILIPLGFYLKAEYPSLDDYATVAIILGLISWVMAYWLVRQTEKRERKERKAFYLLLNAIYEELKGLRWGKDEN